MARKSTGPRYWPTKGGYYVVVKGERVCLAKGVEGDPEVVAEAERKYHEIMLARQVLTEGDRTACVSVLEAFIDHCERNKKKNTYDLWRRVLQPFVLKLGRVAVKDLKQHMVTSFLTEMETVPRVHEKRGEVTWGPGTRSIFLSALKAAFNWAIGEEMITLNPVARMKKPPARSRGIQNRLTEEQFQRVLPRASCQFRDFLIAMNDTGARPGEIAQVTATDFNEELKAWVLVKHKTERTGKKRVIYVTDRVVRILRRLGNEHPEGPVFRNRAGRPWTTGTLAKQFSRIREELGLGAVTPYAIRHKFATEYLLSGGTFGYLKELMGSTIAVLEHHYGHLNEHSGAIRSKLLQFRGENASDPAGPGEESGAAS
jgi:integrase